MIAYFADRNLNILISSSTDLPGGLVIKEDLKTEEIETGVASFSGSIGYNDSNDALCEKALTPGNYVLRKVKEEDDECGIFTIIDMEKDSKSQNIEFSAEDAGLELLNDIALKWPDDDNVNPSPMTLGEYAEMWLDRTGFEIGRDESGSTTKSLSWDQEHTVSNRLLDIASEFGCELNYSFEIEGFRVTKKLVNFYKRRGSDNGVQWRMNKEIDRIVTKATIANLATALLCYGSIPDGATLPITLADFSAITTEGYTIEQIYYADREGRATQGWCLCSSEALKRWGTVLSDGSIKHAVRPFHVETLDQAELYRQGLAELQKIENVEYNFEVDVSDPRDAKIGDTVNIVDEAGRLYLSARLLKLETSEADGKKTATLGDYMFRSSGISEKVRELANQFSGMVVPQITVERNDVTGVTTITATDKNGTTTAEVYDGTQGPQGPAGADGADGDDAPTIVSVIQQWCMSSTRNTFTKATGYDWQDTMPAYASGLYYYTRIKTTYSDNSTTYSTPVLDLSAQVSAEASEVVTAAAAAASASRAAAEAASASADQAAADAQTARTSAVNIANEAKETAEGVAKHFWYDSSGAHVSDVENSVATGNSVTVSSSGIIMMRNGKLVTSWTGTSPSDAALNFYDCSYATARDADLISSYSRSGITQYIANTRAMSLVSSGLVFWDPTDTTNAGTTSQKKRAEFLAAGVNLYASGYITANLSANSLNFYDGSAATASVNNLLAAYTRSGISLYTRASGASVNTRAMSLTPSGLTFWDPSDTTNSGTSSQRKEAVFGASGATLYAGGNKSLELLAGSLKFYASNGSTLIAEYGSTGANLYAGGKLAMALAAGSMNFYASNGTNLLASFGSSGINLYASNVLSMSLASESMQFYKSDGTTLAASITVDSTYGGSMLRVGAGNGYVRSFNLTGGTPTDLIVYNGLADSLANSVPYIYFQGTGSHSEVSIGVQGYFSGSTFWRGNNDAGNGIIIDTDGIEMTGSVYTSGIVSAGTYFRSEYAYEHPGGAAASTVASHTVYIASNGNLLMGSTSSSKRYKHDIKAISEDELNPVRLYELPVIQFVYNEDYLGNKKDCRYKRTLPGFIAEDVEKIYPTAADISEEGKLVGWNAHYMIPPMLALIQEQHERIKALEAKIA